MKLGKLAPRIDGRTLRLGRYLPDLLPVPPACDWLSLARVPFPDYQNTEIGDCAPAGAAHAIHTWSAATGREVVVATEDVIAEYSAIAGFDPARAEETDVGVVEIDLLRRWRKVGFAGHSLGAFASVTPAKIDHVRATIALFGGCYAGLQLPTAAQGQDVWNCTPLPGDPATAPGSWGGHAVELGGFDQEGLLFVSWGEVRRMSWGFWLAYADEAWALIGDDFLTGDRAPNGLDVGLLRRDLARVAETRPE